MNTTATTVTMPANVPPRPPRHRVPIARSYLAELRARCEAAGLVNVARAAKVHRNTLWRTLAGGEGRHPTLESIEAVRRALAKIEGPAAKPMPPPVVAVRGAHHHRWIELAEKLTTADLATVAERPDRVIRAAQASKRRRK